MTRRAVLAVLVTGVLAASAAASAATPPPPSAVAAYQVVSGVDGAVLARRNAAQRRPMASITKLMTALVALERLSPGEVVVVPAVASSLGESTLNLRAGERLTVRELVLGTLVQSGNDAATALAYRAGGGSVPAFVELMNAKARELGLDETRFANPHGLDAPGHVSSARDTVALARAAFEVPLIRRAAGLQRAQVSGGRVLETTDDLLSLYPPLQAGKTGHTSGAGWSQVALASARGVDVWASVLGGPSREQRNADLQSLLAWGLSQYRRSLVVDPRRAYAEVPAPYGLPAVALYAPRRVVRVVRVDRPLVERVVVPNEVTLPVRVGQRLGEVRVLDRGKVIARVPLVSRSDLDEPGVLGKVRWYGTRTLHHLFDAVS